MNKVRVSPIFVLVTVILLVGAMMQGKNTAVAEMNIPDIIGGQEAVPGAWPWMAALVTASEPNAYNGQFCGGALIAPEWVITAAHCFNSTDPTQVDVVLGRHLLSSNEGQRHQVAQIILHPAYNTTTNDSDMALLRLATPSSQPVIPLVRPATANLANPGVNATVTGWGNMDSGGGSNFPDALHQVTLPIVSNEVCNGPDSYNGGITANMVCAGFASGGFDSCQGDSGGPLIVPSPTAPGWAQAGVVSFGIGCAQPNFYGVYARVANFYSWVESHTGPLTDPTPSDNQLYLPLVVKPSAGAPPPPPPSGFAEQVVALVNAERATAGCNPLTIQPQLNQAALAHSEDMALNDFFSHTGSNGSSVTDRMEAAGYTNWTAAGENIAAGQTTPAEVMNSWMNSPGHRANILNCDFADIGVGYYFLENDTGTENWFHYWTQVFGSQ